MVPQTLVVIDLRVFSPQPVATLCLSFRIGKMAMQAAKMNPHHDTHQSVLTWALVMLTTLVMGWDPPFQPSAPWIFLSLSTPFSCQHKLETLKILTKLHVPLKEAIQGGCSPQNNPVFWKSTYETPGRNSCFSRQTALSICHDNNFLSNVILCLESQSKSWCVSAKHTIESSWKSFPPQLRPRSLLFYRPTGNHVPEMFEFAAKQKKND